MWSSKMAAKAITLQGDHKDSGVTAPDTSHREISADLPGKERQGKKGKMEKNRRKIRKGKVENWKWK